MIQVSIVLGGEPLEVSVVQPAHDAPIGVVRIGYGNDAIQSSDPAALEALAASVLEAASRLRAARDVYDTQQQQAAVA